MKSLCMFLSIKKLIRVTNERVFPIPFNTFKQNCGRCSKFKTVFSSSNSESNGKIRSVLDAIVDQFVFNQKTFLPLDIKCLKRNTLSSKLTQIIRSALIKSLLLTPDIFDKDKPSVLQYELILNKIAVGKIF